MSSRNRSRTLRTTCSPRMLSPCRSFKLQTTMFDEVSIMMDARINVLEPLYAPPPTAIFIV
jgi:hypothetical protein